MSNSAKSVFAVKTPKTIDVNLIIRALAVTAVVYWHIHGFSATGAMERMFTVSGRFAVWVFFGLSGYLIGLTIISRYGFTFSGVLSFYRNRLLRILPLFFFVTLVLLLKRCVFDTPRMDLGQFKPLRELLMLQWNQDYPLNGVFWTLGVEIHFYLLAPFLIFCLRRKQVVWSVTGAVLVIGFLLGTKGSGVGQDSRNLLGNLIHFVMGIGVAFGGPVLRSRSQSFTGKHTILLCGVSFLLLLTANSLYFRNFAAFLGWERILLTDGFTASLLILHIMLEARKTRTPRCLSPIMGLGVLSYGVYAWHGALNSLEVSAGSFALNLSGAIILAYLSYIIIETPLRRYRIEKASV